MELYSHPFIYLFIFGTKLKRETAGSLAHYGANIFTYFSLSERCLTNLRCGDHWRVLSLNNTIRSLERDPHASERGFLYLYIYLLLYPGSDDEVWLNGTKKEMRFHSLWLKVNDPPSPTTFFFCDLFCFFCSSSFPRVRFLITSPSSCCCYCALGRFPCVL